MHDTITLFMTTFYPFPLFSVISTYSQGINAGLVRIPSVNPYRLPGWFLTALGVTAAIGSSQRQGPGLVGSSQAVT